jgi:Methyltransferase small domain
MEISFLTAILFCLCLLWILASIVLWSFRNDISPMPTGIRTKPILLQAIPREIRPGKIYELGSGWGTLALPLARQYPDFEVIAYETSTIPFLVSLLRAKFARLPNLTILKKNFYNEPLADASLVVCYLCMGAMEKLKEKFTRELQDNTWIISNTFAIAEWKPETVYQIRDLYHTKIYVYHWTEV